MVKIYASYPKLKNVATNLNLLFGMGERKVKIFERGMKRKRQKWLTEYQYLPPKSIKVVNDFNDLNALGQRLLDCKPVSLFYLNIVTFLVAISPSAEIMRTLYSPGFQASQLMIMRSDSVFSISATSIPDALKICTTAIRCPSMKN